MNELIKFIPLVILTIYNVIRIASRDLKRHWWKAFVLVLTITMAWFAVHTLLKAIDTNLLIFVVLVLFSFELLQVFNYRMSLTFHLLFIIIIVIIAGSGYRHTDLVVTYEYLMLLIYFLAESNQRYMKRTYEESASQYQNMVLTRQVSEVQNIYMTMRGWRHDYHNHLQTLKAHLMLNHMKEAGVYLNKLEEDLDNVNTLIETGNINLDAILNSKLSLALKENINIKYKAEVPSTLTVSDIDLCVLIGNLIDNAVEACENITDENNQRFIRLYIGVLKKQLYITVTNTTSEVAKKLDEEYITSKRGNHGHGLNRINKIAMKYEGYINRKNEPGVFVTEILLPL